MWSVAGYLEWSVMLKKLAVNLLAPIFLASWPDVMAGVDETATPRTVAQDAISENVDARATPEQLLTALPRLMGRYDEVKLQGLLDDFNQSQRDSYNVEQDTFALPEQGYTQFKFSDFGKYFSLDRTVVKESHTDGIDAGIDTHDSIIFSKSPVLEIARRPGPVYLFGTDESLILSAPVYDGCMGEPSPVGDISVYDLKTNVEYFSAVLPRDSISLEAEGRPQKNRINVYTVSTTDVSMENPQRHCEVTSWSRFTTTRFSVRCDPKKQKCTMQKKVIGVKYDCSPIGQCD